ncbi:MAG TPA: isoprenylcysteine carboxylmethyltransferase family protein [Solirubrobacterales bacterium]
MSAWRHAVAIAVLPGTAAVVVPAVILATGEGPDVGWGEGAAAAALTVAAGAVLVAAGVALWAWTVRLFARLGHGTLAPWDPTRHLVVEGPYGHVRNPMISAVLAVLVGEGLALGSPGILIWSAAFLAINAVYFVVSEEPGLERRFGEEYRAYKAAVPRWIPRRTPWERPRGV